MRAAVLFLLLLSNQDFTESVKILGLEVSGYAAEGSEADLGCQFDMEGERLYSVKWYKDGREFYRYDPMAKQHSSRFPAPGVIVDMVGSSMNVVRLVHLARESAGVYRCEVTAESPGFNTASKEKHVSIYLLPEKGPTITGVQEIYNIGDTVNLNCTSPPSRPDAQLKWLINGSPEPEEYVYGPWYKTTSEGSEAPFQTKLNIHFRVTPDHFTDGKMTISCQSIIAPLYNREEHFTYHLRLPTDTQEQPNNGTSLPSTTIFLIALLCTVYFLLI